MTKCKAYLEPPPRDFQLTHNRKYIKFFKQFYVILCIVSFYNKMQICRWTVLTLLKRNFHQTNLYDFQQYLNKVVIQNTCGFRAAPSEHDEILSHHSGTLVMIWELDFYQTFPKIKANLQSKGTFGSVQMKPCARRLAKEKFVQKINAIWKSAQLTKWLQIMTQLEDTEHP